MPRMIRLCLKISMVILTFFSFAPESSSQVYPSDYPAYKLYHTENTWTLLELETYSGRIWQLQYSVGEDSKRFKLELNPYSLALDYNGVAEVNGRYELYPTQNIYNFILLDTYDGRTWQVQWSIDDDKRGVIGPIDIYSPNTDVNPTFYLLGDVSPEQRISSLNDLISQMESVVNSDKLSKDDISFLQEGLGLIELYEHKYGKMYGKAKEVVDKAKGAVK